MGPADHSNIFTPPPKLHGSSVKNNTASVVAGAIRALLVGGGLRAWVCERVLSTGGDNEFG